MHINPLAPPFSFSGFLSPPLPFNPKLTHTFEQTPTNNLLHTDTSLTNNPTITTILYLPNITINMSRDEFPQIAPATIAREINLTIEYLQQQLAAANERGDQLETVADSLARANERAGNLESQLMELTEAHSALSTTNAALSTTNAALSTTNLELSHTNAELTDEFEDSTAYTGHLHEEVHTLHLEVGFLNEQLRGLHEHQRQQYFLHQQRQAGVNPVPIAANVANPMLSINNVFIANERLRTIIHSLRAELRERVALEQEVKGLQRQNAALQTEVAQLRARLVRENTMR